VADVERVSREIHILKLIRHPNIIQLYEIIETPKQLFLIMEYMGNGELFDYIVKCKKYIILHAGTPTPIQNFRGRGLYHLPADYRRNRVYTQTEHRASRSKTLEPFN
jgi:serine/threonine protein kinase